MQNKANLKNIKYFNPFKKHFPVKRSKELPLNEEAGAGMFSSCLGSNLNFYLEITARLNFKIDLRTLHTYPVLSSLEIVGGLFYASRAPR